jgi:hypothetical protein
MPQEGQNPPPNVLFSHLNKHSLINSLEAEIYESTGLHADAYSALPCEISPVLSENQLGEIIAVAGDGPRPEISIAETHGECLQPVVPLTREMVASLIHNDSLACALRFLRQIAAVGRDYNAQGGLDTKIGCIIWQGKARQERLMRQHASGTGHHCLSVNFHSRQ